MRSAGRRSLVVLMSLVGVVGTPPARSQPPDRLARSGFSIDAAVRAAVLDAVAARLQSLYVFPATAVRLVESLARHRDRGAYDAVTDGTEFAARVTRHLKDASGDAHLALRFSPVPVAKLLGEPDAEAVARHRERMERSNHGFARVEVLPGNFGYLKFDRFANPEHAGPTAAAAMTFMQNVDALVFDLRDNGGGDPRMVALLCSYLFERPTHLNNVWSRASGETTQYWTLPYLPGKRFAETPVYVLTSARSFSAAEEFAYDLKAQGRAKVVGERTAGGAHMTRGERLDARFSLEVPFARAVNPVTGTNWEGTGVIPDVPAPAAKALAVALDLAARDVSARRHVSFRH